MEPRQTAGDRRVKRACYISGCQECVTHSGRIGSGVLHDDDVSSDRRGPCNGVSGGSRGVDLHLSRSLQSECIREIHVPDRVARRNRPSAIDRTGDKRSVPFQSAAVLHFCHGADNRSIDRQSSPFNNRVPRIGVVSIDDQIACLQDHRAAGTGIGPPVDRI